jgi:hypothetical protein
VLEAVPEVGVLRELGRQHLERHFAPQPHLLGEVDDAHPTSPQEGFDAVAGELHADHGVDLHKVI